MSKKNRQKYIVKDLNMNEKIEITDNLEEVVEDVKPEFEDTTIEVTEVIHNDIELPTLKQKIVEPISSEDLNTIKHEMMKHCKLSSYFGPIASFDFIGEPQNLGPITIYNVKYNGNDLKIKAIKNGNKIVYGLA